MKKYHREQHALFCCFRHLVFIVVALLIVVVAAHAAGTTPGDTGNDNGKIVIVKIFTNLVRPLKPQDYQREVDIYLPSAYINSESDTQRFPVIYLLHGSPGNPNDFVKHGHWQIFLEQVAQENGFLPPILVAPNGNYTDAAFGDSEWINSADGENKFEDFIIDEVVPWVDKHYRTVPTAEGRVIGGVSEGGYGAVNIALHNPAVFGSVIALSGYYMNDGSGWARKIMGHNKEFLAFNSPLEYINAPLANAQQLLEWQSQRYFIGSGLDEKRYTTESKAMADQLIDHKITCDLCQLDGKHGWELWNTLFIAGVCNIFLPGHPTTESIIAKPQQSL